MGEGFSAEGADPAFGRLLHDLNFGVAGAGEQFAMPARAEERQACACGVFFGQLGNSARGSLVDFRDDDDGAAGLGDAEDFARVAGQIGPPEVRLQGGDDIKHTVGKRQLGNGAVPHFNAAEFDPMRVRSLGCGDALFGIIHAADFSLRGHCC